MADLETPGHPDTIYRARDDEVGDHRPTFTGDVYEIDTDHLVMILQHPCALRHGVDLHPKLLAAPVIQEKLPSDWARCPYGKMPLPKLIGDAAYSVDFVKLELVESSILRSRRRIAVLSRYGVDLLMQRWVHHNTRLVVPSTTYTDSTIGPFDEADLVEEWIESRTDEGMTHTLPNVSAPDGSMRRSVTASGGSCSVIRSTQVRCGRHSVLICGRTSSLASHRAH